VVYAPFLSLAGGHAGQVGLPADVIHQHGRSPAGLLLVDNIRWQSYLSGMTTGEAEEWGVDDTQRPYFVRYG
ncbi:helicase RepA family protein, partial [Aeromonas caviae]|uniref:helicase RepA family protein n=1 Tax=Aeromonas caviae TaxID=648 RepID=UPI001CC637B7